MNDADCERNRQVSRDSLMYNYVILQPGSVKGGQQRSPWGGRYAGRCPVFEHCSRFSCTVLSIHSTFITNAFCDSAVTLMPMKLVAIDV